MSAVEDKIVSMKFDNKQFEPAAKTTMSTLQRLKAALNLSGAGKGLNDLQSTASRFSLANLGTAATGVSGKFAALATVGIAALATITSKAVDAGLKIAKAFTIEPLKQGFQEYETQLNSVQTILANTSASGASLKDVNGALDQLNTYADKTIYNFGEMAKNIGTFTAAGVDLDTSVQSIKGIANLAALSGSNSQQASTAMYQLSQAISAGKVGLQDWNSVVNAGMGGAVFQRALATTAEKMGTLEEGSVKLSGKMKNATINGQSFRESITAKPGEKSWLTSDVLTSTLKQFTGDLTDAELKAQGFNDQQIKDIQTMAKTANDAATQVKTFSQLVGTLQEAAGSGWASTFEIIIGDFEEAKKLFTAVNKIVGGYVSKSADARNKMLQTWKDLGGRTALLEGLKNVFNAIVQVITPIRDAFREIFPATTGKQLADMSKQFLAFTKGLKLGADTIDNIKRTAKGFFAVLSIGVSLVKAVLGFIGSLVGMLFSGSGAFLETTASIGDFLVKLDAAIKKGDVFNRFFDKLAAVIGIVAGAIKDAAIAFVGLFDGFDSGGLSRILDNFKNFSGRLDGLGDLPSKLMAGWDKVSALFAKIGAVLAPAFSAIGDALSGVGTAIADAFRGGDFSGVFDVLNVTLLGGILLAVKSFFGKGGKLGLDLDVGGGALSNISGAFGQLTDTLKAMQTQIQAKTLLLIAGAVALLTVSIVALSMIDSAKLTTAMTALGVAMGQLLIAMAILSKITASGGFLKIPFVAGSMILLATALLILTASVKVLSTMSWEELLKGLGGVAVLLGVLVAASKGLGGAGAGLAKAGFAMIPLAIGIKILASAMKDLSGMSWSDLAKGMSVLAVSMGLMAAMAQILSKASGSMISAGVALVIVAAGLKLLAGALQDFGGMSWEEIAKAGVVLAGSLLLIAGGLYLMTAALPGAAALIVAAAGFRILAPALQMMSELSWEDIGKVMVVLAGSLILMAAGLTAMIVALPGAAALVVASSAFAILVPVMQQMGELSWGDIAKGMVVMAGALTILAVGLTAMLLAIPGAIALTIAAGALAILVPVLQALAGMTWGEIAKGLIAIAAAFAVLGIGSLLLLPVIPALLALAAALIILGAAMVLIGAGALLLSIAFTTFAAAGAAGIATLTGLIALIPLFLSAFARGIIGFATTLAANAATFINAFKTLISALLDAVIELTPKIGKAISTMLTTILTIIRNAAPQIAATGVALITAFLTAISNNVGRVTTLAGDIIVKFLQSMQTQVPRIVSVGVDLIITLMNAVQQQQGRLIQAGISMIINFINSLANSIRSNAGALRSAGVNLAIAIVDGMSGGLISNIGRLASTAANMARSALNAAKAALGVNSPSKEFFKVGSWSADGMILSMDKRSDDVGRSGAKMAKTALEAVRDTMSGMSGLIDTNLDMSPTIRPVLDLGKLTQDAKSIGGLLGNQSMRADISRGQANGIANAASARAAEATNDRPTIIQKDISIEQNNYSPKALPAGEIYQNTKSLINIAKEELTK